MRLRGFTLIELPVARKSQSEGFTLIELLVVISIIALLIAILLPSLTKAREAAKQVACGAQLHQMAVAVYAYAQDYRGAAPPGNNGVPLGSPAPPRSCQSGVTSLEGGEVVYWGPGLLASRNYIVPEMMWCPSRQGELYGEFNDDDAGFVKWPLGPHVSTSYVHRNDHPRAGLEEFARLADIGRKAWLADLGFFFNIHETLPDKSRGVNHEGGYEVMYFDGSVSWYADAPGELLSNGDGGLPPALDPVYGRDAWAKLDRGY